MLGEAQADCDEEDEQVSLAACLAANEPLLHRAVLHRPLSILKYAMTLDGKIATSTGHSAWVSSAESRACVFAMRARWAPPSDRLLVHMLDFLRSGRPCTTAHVCAASSLCKHLMRDCYACALCVCHVGCQIPGLPILFALCEDTLFQICARSQSLCERTAGI